MSTFLYSKVVSEAETSKKIRLPYFSLNLNTSKQNKFEKSYLIVKRCSVLSVVIRHNNICFRCLTVNKTSAGLPTEPSARGCFFNWLYVPCSNTAAYSSASLAEPAIFGRHFAGHSLFVPGPIVAQ